MAKIRFTFAFEGTLIAARVVPMRDDPSKLVLKHPDRDCLEATLKVAGVEGEFLSEGAGRGGFYCAAVPKDAFLEALPKFVGTLLADSEPTKKVEPAEEEEAPTLSLVPPAEDESPGVEAAPATKSEILWC